MIASNPRPVTSNNPFARAWDLENPRDANVPYE
jgi:hypothetical protein